VSVAVQALGRYDRRPKIRIQRQPDAVVPEDLRQIASALAEDVEIAAVRIALQLLLNLKRQSPHAATHVGVARRDPHTHPTRHRDHNIMRPMLGS